MNTVPQPRERLPLEEGEIRDVPIGTIKGCHMKLHGYGADIHIAGIDEICYLTQTEAIDAAKAILIAFNVPFKNAVKGSGVRG